MSAITTTPQQQFEGLRQKFVAFKTQVKCVEDTLTMLGEMVAELPPDQGESQSTYSWKVVLADMVGWNTNDSSLDTLLADFRESVIDFLA